MELVEKGFSMRFEGAKRASRAFAMASSMGFMMALSILLGYFIGRSLDRWLGTEPWLMVIFLLFGVAAGFTECLRVIKMLIKEKNKGD